MQFDNKVSPAVDEDHGHSSSFFTTANHTAKRAGAQLHQSIRRASLAITSHVPHYHEHMSTPHEKLPIFVYRPSLFKKRQVRHLVRKHKWTRTRPHYTYRERLHMLLDVPLSSITALVLSFFDLFMVASSIFCSYAATSDVIMDYSGDKVRAMDSITAIYFCICLILRFLACPFTPTYPKLTDFMKDPITIADFAVVIPYMMQVTMKHDSTNKYVLALFGMLECLRAWKLINHFPKGTKVLQRTLSKSLDAMAAPTLLLLVVCMAASTCLYWLEGTHRLGMPDDVVIDYELSQRNRLGGNDTDVYVYKYPTTFESQIEAAWFVVVTITTTGYGGKIVSSALGKWIASTLMFISLVLFAMPLAIVGRYFVESYDRRYLDDSDLAENEEVRDVPGFGNGDMLSNHDRSKTIISYSAEDEVVEKYDPACLDDKVKVIPPHGSGRDGGEKGSGKLEAGSKSNASKAKILDDDSVKSKTQSLNPFNPMRRRLSSMKTKSGSERAFKASDKKIKLQAPLPKKVIEDEHICKHLEIETGKLVRAMNSRLEIMEMSLMSTTHQLLEQQHTMTKMMQRQEELQKVLLQQQQQFFETSLAQAPHPKPKP